MALCNLWKKRRFINAGCYVMLYIRGVGGGDGNFAISENPTSIAADEIIILAFN